MGGPKKVAGGDHSVQLTIPEPNEKQRQFFLSRKKYTAYGGARAGGKSWAVRAKAVSGALRYAGIRILIMRRTYPELESNIIAPLNRMIGSATADGNPAGQLIADYSATLRTVFFRNGSAIKFGHLQSRADLPEYQGQEFDWIFLDEATQFTEYEFRMLGACLRGVNDFPKRMYLTCNPGGVGHRWVKRLFVSREYTQGETPGDYLFIPATVDDNTALSPAARKDYIASLDLLPEDIRAAHRYGDWDAMAGQYFSEFRRERHVCRPFLLPREWPRYRVFDYGLDMFACYWAAIDADGRIWFYREYCQSGLIVSEAAAAMRSLTPADEFVQYTIAPPDMWSTQKDSGRTMAEVFTANGIGLVKASNARVQGWMLVKEALSVRADGRPGMMVFSTCTRLIRDLPALQHDDENPSDCAKEPHDITHAPDACRYFCAFRALGAGAFLTQAQVPEEDERREEYDAALCGDEVSESYLTY